MVITSLHEHGAQKIFTSLCIKTPKMGYSFNPVVVSILGGYYLQFLRINNIQTFVLFEKGFNTTLKNILGFLFYMIKKKIKFQIINAFLPHAGFLGVILKIWTGARLTYSIRFTPSFTFRYKKKPINIINHRISIFFADYITCNSPFAFKELKTKYPSKRISLIVNGTTSPEAQPNDVLSKIKTDYFKPHFKFKVVTTCNLRDSGKDIDTLLLVADRLREFQFIVVGGGKRLAELNNKIKKLNLTNVTFTGHQDNVWPFLFCADAFLFLTLFEGFPNSILEAMAAKLPIIASDIPQIREMLTDGEECILVQNGNVDIICRQIITLFKNPSLKKLLAANALNKIKNEFSERQMIASFYEVYTRMNPE